MRAHLLAGFAGMTAQTLAVAMFGLRALVRPVKGAHAILSMILGAVAVVALVSLVLAAGTPSQLQHPGLVQKTVQGATDLWVLASAVAILTGSGGG